MTMILFPADRSSRRGGRKCKPFLHLTSRFFSGTLQSQTVQWFREGSQYSQNTPSNFASEGVSNLKNSHLRTFGSLKFALDIVRAHRLLSRIDMGISKSTNTHVVRQQPFENFYSHLKPNSHLAKILIFGGIYEQNALFLSSGSIKPKKSHLRGFGYLKIDLDIV